MRKGEGGVCEKPIGNHTCINKCLSKLKSTSKQAFQTTFFNIDKPLDNKGNELCNYKVMKKEVYVAGLMLV